MMAIKPLHSSQEFLPGKGRDSVGTGAQHIHSVQLGEAVWDSGLQSISFVSSTRSWPCLLFALTWKYKGANPAALGNKLTPLLVLCALPGVPRKRLPSPEPFFLVSQPGSCWPNLAGDRDLHGLWAGPSPVLQW